ncbi:MAG: hypothetical protein ACYTF8_04705, partial [Planctomycetota bacterium]
MRLQTLPCHHDVQGGYAHIGRGLREIDHAIAANTGSDLDNAVRLAGRTGGLALADRAQDGPAGLGPSTIGTVAAHDDVAAEVENRAGAQLRLRPVEQRAE